MLLSRIDEVSAGTVTYPPGGTLGPRGASATSSSPLSCTAARADVRVDGPRRALQLRAGRGRPAAARPSRALPLRPRDRPTRHSWVQAHVPEPPAALTDRVAGLPAVPPLSPALETLTSEAVAAAATPLSTQSPLLAHLAAAAFWRYVGEAERGRPSPAWPVDDAQRHIHAHLGDPALSLSGIAAAAHVTPALSRVGVPRRARRPADGLCLAAARRARGRPPREHGTAAGGRRRAQRLQDGTPPLPPRARGDRHAARPAAPLLLGAIRVAERRQARSRDSGPCRAPQRQRRARPRRSAELAIGRPHSASGRRSTPAGIVPPWPLPAPAQRRSASPSSARARWASRSAPPPSAPGTT